MIELVMHSNRGDVFGHQLKSHSRVAVCQPHFLRTEISACVNHLVLVHGQIWSVFKISRKFLFEGFIIFLFTHDFFRTGNQFFGKRTGSSTIQIQMNPHDAQ